MTSNIEELLLSETSVSVIPIDTAYQNTYKFFSECLWDSQTSCVRHFSWGIWRAWSV